MKNFIFKLTIFSLFATLLTFLIQVTSWLRFGGSFATVRDILCSLFDYGCWSYKESGFLIIADKMSLTAFMLMVSLLLIFISTRGD